MQEVYDWIRRKDASARIPLGSPIVKIFPQGPSEESLEMVDIVIVTPDSMS